MKHDFLSGGNKQVRAREQRLKHLNLKQHNGCIYYEVLPNYQRHVFKMHSRSNKLTPPIYLIQIIVQK